MVGVLDSGAVRARVQIAAATLSGNSLRQTAHTHCAYVHQAAKLVAAILRVARVTVGLAESNGSLPTGLWFTSPAGWLPKTGISSGAIRSAIEYGLPLPFLHFPSLLHQMPLSTHVATSPCGTKEKNKEAKQICSEVSVNSPGNPRSQSWYQLDAVQRATGCIAAATYRVRLRNKNGTANWILPIISGDPTNLLLPAGGDAGPHLSPQAKQHLDRYSHVGTAHSCDQQTTVTTGHILCIA